MDENETMLVQMVIINEFGEFHGMKAIVNKEQYEKIIAMSKLFYKGGFQITCEDGTYVVFPPEIVQKSILKVKKIKEDV